MQAGLDMIAFTFPGQGSQKPAMGAPWKDHESWSLVTRASEVSGRDIGRLLLDTDAEELTDTRNAQISTFVLSLVVLDAVARTGVMPARLAGHSLGEYSALAAAGVLGFDDGVRLVTERGEAMADAGTQQVGTMAAVLGLDDDQVEIGVLGRRRRRVGCQLQRPRPGRHRRLPRRDRTGGRHRQGDGSQANPVGSRCRAPSTPRSWPMPATD